MVELQVLTPIRLHVIRHNYIIKYSDKGKGKVIPVQAVEALSVARG
jgi:hypothetical protein